MATSTRTTALGMGAAGGLAGFCAGGPLAGIGGFLAGAAAGLGIGWSQFGQSEIEKIIAGGQQGGRELLDQTLGVIKATERYLIAGSIVGVFYRLAISNLYSHCYQTSTLLACNVPVVTDTIIAVAACTAAVDLIFKSTNRVDQLAEDYLKQKNASLKQKNASPPSQQAPRWTGKQVAEAGVAFTGLGCFWGGVGMMFVNPPVGFALLGGYSGIVIAARISKW